MNYATPEGTLKYQTLKNIPNFHFRKSIYTQNLLLSSLGMGTYLGGINSATDSLVEEAIVESLQSGGLNVLDTAINYRYQKSERVIGKTLQKIFKKGEILREQIFISTKIGYVPGDGDKQEDPRKYLLNLLSEKIVRESDIIDNIHSMHPNYLEHQLNQSLSNLKLKTIDLLYLHNSAEAQIPSLGIDKYLDQLHRAFSFLEEKRKEKKIQYYGLATWNCFRVNPIKKNEFLNLQDVVSVAEEIAGNHHGFKFVQLPLNLQMNESLVQNWQKINKKSVSFLQASDLLKIGIFGSVPLLQTKLLQIKAPNFTGLSSKAQKFLQYVRSIPHESLIAPLVGHKSLDHVRDNLDLMYEEPASKESFESISLG